MSEPDSNIDPGDVDLVRRRLLKAGAYTAPAILASLMLNREAQAGSASCPPYLNRCSPLEGVCPPFFPC